MHWGGDFFHLIHGVVKVVQNVKVGGLPYLGLLKNLRVQFKEDGFVYSPTSVLRCILRHCSVP
jgi:hypothetical protein